MAISPMCDVCNEELGDFGALMFSPPDESGKTDKKHICKACYNKLKQEYGL